MAHNITSSDNVFSVREPMWHNLGTVLEDYLTWEQCWQMIAPWDVQLHDLFTEFGVPVDARATVRGDNGEVLGIVGPRYVPLQNGDAFKFFDEVIGSGEAFYETAGTLGGGKTLWALARMPKCDIQVGNTDDRIQSFLALTNSHDGTAAVRAFKTDVRIVCQNTLNQANASAKGKTKFTARHTTNMMGKVREAQDILGLAVKQAEENQQAYDYLLETPVNVDVVELALEKMFPSRENAERDTWSGPRGQVKELFEDSITCNLPGIEGTAWSLYNAFTEYSDHFGRSMADERRFESAVLGGPGMEFKEEAFAYCLSL